MEAVRETAVHETITRRQARDRQDGRHETITLQAETTTPRARTHAASFVRECTPLGELPPARRQRNKNEGKARARAVLRLDPVKHGQYREAERARKSGAAQRAARGELEARGSKKRLFCEGAVDLDAGIPSPPWKQQARQRVAADLQASEQRKAQRVAYGQLCRERRAALAPGARCGSCATCVLLIRFGGTRTQHTGKCETALLSLGQ
jgi:hypothetical protein